MVADLKDGEDVEGVVLIGERDYIIACELSSNYDHRNDIGQILKLINEDPKTLSMKNDETIFTCSELDYNGFKVLVKKVRDKLTLLVLLRKRSYVSLAMLNFENTIRMIDSILDGFIPENTYT